MLDILENLLYPAMSLYEIISIKYKIKSNTLSNIFNGIGIGVVSNGMFVLALDQKVDDVKLSFTFIFGIILLAISSIEKKD